MSDEAEATATAPESTVSSSTISWAEFLASIPPGQRRLVDCLAEKNRDWWTILTPEIKLFCPNEACEREVFFDFRGQAASISPGECCWKFIDYRCRHCKQTAKLFAVLLKPESKNEKILGGEAEKLGECPAFGPHVPTRLNKLIGEDRDFFFKGRRAESQGMGIGAFGYYRRVVENQKNRILDEIIRVCQRIGANDKVIKELERAKAETQFKKAVEKIKKGIPEVLKINGHNPLLLLHHALSEGLHAQSDEQCLQLATSIRVVLADLAERLDQALKEEAELQNAVSRLLQTQPGTRVKPSLTPGAKAAQVAPPPGAACMPK